VGVRTLKWTISHAVFVTEIDDEHKEIFEALADCRRLFDSGGDLELVLEATQRLTTRLADHFAHEERLMRAARYEGMRWHKQRHDAARKRVEGFVLRIGQGVPDAGPELVEHLTGWLHNHTRVADQMMAAALRNHQRCMWKVTFHAGTKPAEACDWVTIDGEAFDPPTREKTS
jgi:hemerythrin